jgi:molybdopterin-binding protein
MASGASVTVTGSVTSMLGGNINIGPATFTSLISNGTIQHVVLQAGANTITVPTQTANVSGGVLIVLPATNTSVTTLKGVTGDTGIAIGKTSFSLITWDPAAVPASFVLTSVSTQTGLYTELIFF